MTDKTPIVFIVDDDSAVLDSIGLLMKSVGLEAKLFESAQSFLDSYSTEQSGCLVLDVRMPGISGLDLQAKLIELGCILPIIFITGHGDIPMAVKAMQDGAVDFLQKPFRDQELLDRVQNAIEEDSKNRSQHFEKHNIEQRLAALTEREHQVLDMIIAGKANKLIAADLGLSQRTIEIHRAHILEKMQTRSLAHLVRMIMMVSE